MAQVRNASNRQIDFSTAFQALTGFAPMPWQEALYERFVSGDEKNIPAACNLPTGLGKTSVIAIWLIALANWPSKLPRRLVYVVNRRTVVDQTTDEAEKLQRNAATAGVPMPAISTLRGQFADNREWSADPSRPAVICGTVDMIGSRLLFSGYGVGFKAKPLHAGFLGQDALLVHDEAHLEPAFQKLILDVEREQTRERERGGDLPWPNLRVMALSATTRHGQKNKEVDSPFGLTPDELTPPKELPHPPTEPIHHVWRRIKAKKRLTLHQVGDGKDAVAEKIADFAKQRKESKAAVLIFVRTLDDVKKVCDRLTSKKDGVPADCVQQLTGTMRGLERDRMAKCDPVFMRFLPEKNRNPHVQPAEGAVYLVCTSAGEVGVDISADHMICDLSTFESMAQRFGRVNRYGDGDARIDVVHPAKFDENDKLTPVRRATLILLELLVKRAGDASPWALGNLDPAERLAAFAPEPTILPATDILFDAWAMTSIRSTMPGRPDVAPYLHGVADKIAQATVAWRAELDRMQDEGNDTVVGKKLKAIFAKHRIRPHESLTTNSFRVIEFLKSAVKKQQKLADVRVAVLFGRTLRTMKIGDLIDDSGPLYVDCEPTLVLPASLGGLKEGMLDASAVLAEPPSDSTDDKATSQSLDVADREGYEPHQDAPTRMRVWLVRTEDGWQARSFPDALPLSHRLDLDDDYPKSTKLVRDIANRTGLRVSLVQPLETDEEGDACLSLVCLSHRPNRNKQDQSLKEHVDAVQAEALRIVESLQLPKPYRSALLFAAAWHDEGKKADVWQRFIGQTAEQRERGEFKGKSADWCDPKRLGRYRHEFGSLVRLEHPDRSGTQCSLRDDEDARELALHLIASHHGFARPHFDAPVDREFPSVCDQTHVAAIRRFASLQRRYGRWGLAYLESLLRAADWAASGDEDAEDDVEEGAAK